jgi:hypothetical protein
MSRRAASQARTPEGEAGASAERSPDADDPRARLARAVRMLGVTGRRLLEHNGAWSIFARGDRRMRALLLLRPADVEQLKAEGLIIPAVSGGYVLAPDNRVEAPAPDVQPAAGPWLFEFAGVRVPKRNGGNFARLARNATCGQGPLSLRQAMAGLKLIEDAEQGARVASLTMNWDAAPADKNRRSGGEGRPVRAARAAQVRINRVKAALEEGEFAFIYSACIQGVSLRVLERRQGLPRHGGPRALGAALEKVADVYDG